MTPPAGRAAQPHQARCLGGDAVRGHQLLLLTHRVQETERVHAEADHAQRHQREQAEHRAGGRAYALALLRRSEHQERQHQPRRQLHANSNRDRTHARA